MKHIYVNFKRFDVPAELGGINTIAPVAEWADGIIGHIAGPLSTYAPAQARFTMFFPEAHILPAAAAARGSAVAIGCQGVFHEDVHPGGNFGAFTTSLPAAAARALGCGAAIIGHCEERRKYAEFLAEAGHSNDTVIHSMLNRSLQCACKQGLQVLYCIGETAEQRSDWKHVLRAQLQEGLLGIPREPVTIAYEPVWAIGPGKTPPERESIRETAQFIKEETGGLPVVYGGGLKADNAAMLASIPEIDGGLIALTRFSGDIGFYPEEYLEIVRLYLS